jgi:hypothetical protein
MVDAEREHVDARRQRFDGGVAAEPEQRLIAWIDRVDVAGEPDALEVLDDGAADRGPLGGAEYGDGARLEERVEVDGRILLAGAGA